MYALFIDFYDKYVNQPRLAQLFSAKLNEWVVSKHAWFEKLPTYTDVTIDDVDVIKTFIELTNNVSFRGIYFTYNLLATAENKLVFLDSDYYKLLTQSFILETKLEDVRYILSLYPSTTELVLMSVGMLVEYNLWNISSKEVIFSTKQENIIYCKIKAEAIVNLRSLVVIYPDLLTLINEHVHKFPFDLFVAAVNKFNQESKNYNDHAINEFKIIPNIQFDLSGFLRAWDFLKSGSNPVVHKESSIEDIDQILNLLNIKLNNKIDYLTNSVILKQLWHKLTLDNLYKLMQQPNRVLLKDALLSLQIKTSEENRNLIFVNSLDLNLFLDILINNYEQSSYLASSICWILSCNAKITNYDSFDDDLWLAGNSELIINALSKPGMQFLRDGLKVFQCDLTEKICFQWLQLEPFQRESLVIYLVNFRKYGLLDQDIFNLFLDYLYVFSNPNLLSLHHVAPELITCEWCVFVKSLMLQRCLDFDFLQQSIARFMIPDLENASEADDMVNILFPQETNEHIELNLVQTHANSRFVFYGQMMAPYTTQDDDEIDYTEVDVVETRP